MDTLAQRARLLREYAGIGQREADRLAGTHRGFTGEIERGGRVNPRAGGVSKLARLYGVTVEFLISGDGETPSKDNVAAKVAALRTTEVSQ